MEREFPKSQLRWAPLLTISGAIIISAILFLLIPMTQILNPVKPANVVVREMVLLPPPAKTPPPPDSSEPPPEPAPPELAQVPPPIMINALDVSLSTGTGDAIAIGVPSPDLVVQDITSEIEEMFTFDDLQDAPRPVSLPRFRFPPSLIRRGIESGKVVLEIDILPSGRAEFRRVISATHEELIETAKQIVSRARFSRPIVDGQAQRVRGSFPLLLENWDGKKTANLH